MGRNSKKRQVTIEFNQEDGAAILTYYHFIRDHAIAGDRIPEKVINRFINFFEVEEFKITEEIKALVDQVKEQTLVHFSHKEEYKSIDIQNLISVIFQEIEINFLKIKEKSSFINFVFSAIDIFYKNRARTHAKEITINQRCNICGFIVIKFGYHFKDLTKSTPNSDLTNQVLWQALKHYYYRISNK